MLLRFFRLLAVTLVVLVLGWTLLAVLAPTAAGRLTIATSRRWSGFGDTRYATLPRGFKMAYLDSQAGGFNFGKDAAEAGPPLVIVPGLGMDKDSLVPLARRLTRHMRVIIIDPAGSGESSRPPNASYRIADQARRVTAFLDELELDQVNLAGAGVGGWVVTAVASARPKKVESLWLLAPAGVAGAVNPEMPVVDAQGHLVPGRIFTVDGTDYVSMLERAMSHPPYVPQGVRLLRQQRAEAEQRLQVRIYAASAADWRSMPMERLASGVGNLPTLITWGADDRLLSARGGRILQRIFVYANLQILPDVGNMPALEDPVGCANAYLAFRTTLSSSSEAAQRVPAILLH